MAIQHRSGGIVDKKPKRNAADTQRIRSMEKDLKRATVFEEESMELSARMFTRTCFVHGVDPEGLVLHADNGGAMKGSTMKATLQRLGVIPSFSRPKVSDDNPYSEALFRTMKYRPEYPSGAFETIEQAQHGSMILSAGTTPATSTAPSVS